MTVTATNSYSGPYLGTGAQTAFPYTFKALSADEVGVLVDGATQSSGYTVTLGTDGNGGTVTFDTAPDSGAQIIPVSIPSFEQDIAFTDAGPFSAATHDIANDRADIRDIYLKGLMDRAIKVPVGDTATNLELPSVSERSANFLAFDADGNPVAASGTGADAGLRTDLAASTGSGLLGYLSTKVGAVFRTLRARLSDSTFLTDFGAVGDGITDCTAAFTAAFASGADRIFIPAGTFLTDHANIPSSVTIQCASRDATIIQVTGDGGGAPSYATNGGVTMFGTQSHLADCTIQYNNPALQCILNVSGTSAAGAGSSTVRRVKFRSTGLTASQVQAIGVYLANLTGFSMTGCFVGSAPGLKQDIVRRGFFNGCDIDRTVLRPHAYDPAAGVYHDANYQLDSQGSEQGSSYSRITFEGGPNGAYFDGQGAVTVDKSYLGDGITSKGYWLPGKAYAQGDFVYPSASTTGSIDIGVSATTLNLASAAAAYVGQRVTIIGAGAAGANLSTVITALSGTTATIANAAATTVPAGTGVYYPVYRGHAYRCTVAGTSDASQPAFPTASGATVADNTVTWREYGACAWINHNPSTIGAGKNTLTVSGSYISNGICGIRSVRVGGWGGNVSVKDNLMYAIDYCGQFDSVFASRVEGNNFNGYTVAGFEYLGTVGSTVNNFAAGNFTTNVTNAADFVISTNNANMGGKLDGNSVITGIGSARWGGYDPTGRTYNAGVGYKVSGTQVVSARATGWAADTGTAKKTANATYTKGYTVAYTAGSTLTYSAAYVQAEQTAMASRMATVEAALASLASTVVTAQAAQQDTSQTVKAIKDALIAHGLIGT